MHRDAADTVAVENTEPLAQSIAGWVATVRRRLRPMLLTFGATFAAALLAAFFWPATYRSSGTILIEQQVIPSDMVRSAVSSYADQRVQIISQRVMTSANLLNVIEKYNLFPGERDRVTREALVDRMRRDIRLDMISADVVDPRQGRATKATIAFSVSYDSRLPAVAARVANELTTLYLSENIETRRQLASDTADFLHGESERLGKRVAEVEAQIADFKMKNGQRLPEFSALNLQMLDRSEQELRELNSRVRSLDQQIVYLDSQLVQIDPSGSSVIANGERVLSGRDRLKVLRANLASMSGVYSADHPDIKRLKREIAGLEAEVGRGDAVNDIARQLEQARIAFAGAQERYGADHPDVRRLQAQVDSLNRALAEEVAKPADARVPENLADNPAYIAIRAQKTAAINERAALQEQIAQVRGRVADLEARRISAPEVEREYSALVRSLQNEQAKFAEVRQKEMDAQLSENLETERKGERFTLIEPPLQPEKPVSPNRPAILVLGFVLGIGAAIGLMLLLETLDTSIRDRAHVIRLLGVPPLAVISLIELDEERRPGLLNRWRQVGSVAAAVVAVGTTFVAARLVEEGTRLAGPGG